jgi:hypothetical protein
MNLETRCLIVARQSPYTWGNRSKGIFLGDLMSPINLAVNRMGIINEAVSFYIVVFEKLIRIMLYVEFRRLFLGRHDEH